MTHENKEVILNLFEIPNNANIQCVEMQKQRHGSPDCEVFAIAAAVIFYSTCPFLLIPFVKIR